MISTHSLLNSENRPPKNELSSLKFFNFPIDISCIFAPCHGKGPWPLPTGALELHNHNYMYSSSCFNPCNFQYVCLSVQDVNLGWFPPIVSLIRKIGFIKMALRVWKFPTTPFATLEISYIILNGFKSNLGMNWMTSNKLHEFSECNFFWPTSIFSQLLGTI